MRVDGVDDAAQFEGVRAACGTIGMDADTQMQVSLMEPPSFDGYCVT